MVLDTRWKAGDNPAVRFRLEHLVMLENVLGRRRESEDSGIHHLDGIKTDNRYVNFFVCYHSRHRKMEHLMGAYLKNPLAPGEPPMGKIEATAVLLSLGTFKRLHGMFVQQEIYEKWRAEGRIKDWSEGPKADWELSGAQRKPAA